MLDSLIIGVIVATGANMKAKAMDSYIDPIRPQMAMTDRIDTTIQGWTRRLLNPEKTK